ncbi:MAG: cytochrome c3 family protein [Myxococcales bacterium]|jgi:predicted CXXCH cytochrome family protein
MRSWVPLSLAAGSLVLFGAGWSARVISADLARPLSVSSGEYVGSQRCRHCHPSRYESWHRTFHRTMTQEASEASVLGDFDGARFEYMGVQARMLREPDGGFAMEMSRAGGAERWRARVERTVGSRRYQQYLTRKGSLYYRLPLAWNVEEARWMHMNGAFLTPDPEPPSPAGSIGRADFDRHVTRWNDNCIFCHNVAPNPGLDPVSGTLESSVAELGIGCEACHGPASEHLSLNHNPLRRFALHLGAGADPSVAHPGRLSPARSSEVCGRCHGQRITRDIDAVHREGDRFVPGQDLTRYSRPLARDTTLNGEPGVFAPRFWPDGTARLTAYEYQGLLQSPCAERGELQCTSCHAMHAGDPRGQLRPDRPGDAMCTQCHDELAEADAVAAHARHDPGSAGSHCVGCHMPRSVYGLVRAHRSHRVASPPSDPLAAAGSPNACVLCHVDRDLGWATAQTRRLWGADGRGRDAEASPDAMPELTRMLLSGDPIERAVAADALGGPEADAAGADAAARAGLLLDSMLRDDYPAVRAIAWRSLRALLSTHGPGAALHVRAFTPTDGRIRRARAIARIRTRLRAADVRVVQPDPAAAQRLRAEADDARIFIGE